MLIYPKTLLKLWSDYSSTAIDVDAMTRAALKENSPLSAGNPNFRRMLDSGFTDDWTLRHAETVAGRLEDWCVENERYFRGVAWPAHESADESIFWPKFMKPRWWQFWLSDSRDVKIGQEKIGYEIKPLKSRDLNELDLLLIDAPICIDREGPHRGDYLCDVPQLIRKDDDARVTLIMPDRVRERLVAYGSTGADWMPFCRTLGVVRPQSRGTAIEVLRVSTRAPKFTEVGWSTRLLDEAEGAKFDRVYQNDSYVGFSAGMELYRLSAKQARNDYQNKKEMAGASFADVFGPDLASEFLQSGVSVGGFLERENNPYLHGEGFWTATACLLTAWRDHFPMTVPQVSELLKHFDAAYDRTWTNTIDDLAVTGLLRFTPEAMHRIRTRLATLLPRPCPPEALEDDS